MLAKRSHALNNIVTGVTLRFFIAALSTCLSSPAFRAIIWMFSRTVEEPDDANEVLQIAQETFLKEFHASQVPFPHSSDIDHSWMYRPYRLRRRNKEPWMLNVEHIMDRFVSKMNRKSARIIFPQVQRRKNVSRETARLYNELNGNTHGNDVRTADLERFYHETGYRIGGGCELRCGQRFNDLKPRFYYCQGGRDYHAAKYVKGIAVTLMESIPSTTANIRRNPDAYLTSDFEQDFVTTWDYQAFTTNLEQLKYFLDALCTGLRSMVTHDMLVFDSHKGLIRIHPADLIEEYNHTVNFSAPFSIHRIIEKFDFASEIPDITYRQENNGMLGVAGNIGFSTSTHGIETCKICGPSGCVCVGDDAMGIQPYHPEVELIPHMSKLGYIHPDKNSYLAPYDEGPFKFIKRAMSRDESGRFYLDYLLNLPISAYVDFKFGHRNTPPDLTTYDCMKKTAVAVGSLLWSIYNLRAIEDMDILTSAVHELHPFLREVYLSCSFPMGGSLPGSLLRIGGLERQTTFAIPSIRFESYNPADEDWLEFLFNSLDQVFFSIPILSERFLVRKPEPGETVYGPITTGLKFAEDFGYVEITELREVIVGLSESNQRRIRNAIKRKGTRLQKNGEIRCLKEIPEIFDDIEVFTCYDPYSGDIVDWSKLL